MRPHGIKNLAVTLVCVEALVQKFPQPAPGLGYSECKRVLRGDGGVGAGGEAATTPYLLTRYFGLRAFSTLYGLTWTFYAAAGAIGPVILGRAFDATGSYSSLLVLLAAVLGLAAAMNLLLPRYSDSFSI